jgi:hypothetical protein
MPSTPNPNGHLRRPLGTLRCCSSGCTGPSCAGAVGVSTGDVEAREITLRRCSASGRITLDTLLLLTDGNYLYGSMARKFCAIADVCDVSGDASYIITALAVYKSSVLRLSLK